MNIQIEMMKENARHACNQGVRPNGGATIK